MLIQILRPQELMVIFILVTPHIPSFCLSNNISSSQSHLSLSTTYLNLHFRFLSCQSLFFFLPLSLLSAFYPGCPFPLVVFAGAGIWGEGGDNR